MFVNHEMIVGQRMTFKWNSSAMHDFQQIEFYNNNYSWKYKRDHHIKVLGVWFVQAEQFCGDT